MSTTLIYLISHQREIQKYADSLVSVMKSAAEDSIPISRSKSSRVTGWNDQVREYRDTAIFLVLNLAAVQFSSEWLRCANSAETSC